MPLFQRTSRRQATLTPPTPRATGYASYLNDRQRRGHYFPLFRDYLRTFTIEQAVVLLHIMNVGKAGSDNGFVMATTSFLETGLGIDAEEQVTILEALEAKRVVEVERRGTPPRRHIRVDTDQIERLIAKGT